MSTDKKKEQKKFLIVIVIAYVVLFAFMIYRAQQSPGTCPFLSMCGSTETKETNKVVAPAVVVPEKAKEKAKETKLPVLLELGSKHCVPCKMMEPILAKLEKDYDGILKVKFIDVWLKENIAVGKKYKINSIPVQIFFDAEDKELWRHTGYFTEDEILKKWKELGYDLPALKKSEK